MADIIIWGIDLVNGKFRPLQAGDIPTDADRLAINTATGIQGASGLGGATGFMGPFGVSGLQGTTGIQGRTGIVGVAPGNRGLDGDTGLIGMTGIGTATGLTGATGTRGVTGNAGAGYAAYSFLNSATTITGTAKIVGIDSSGGPLTITLPASAGLSFGQEFIFQDEAGLAGDNNITIAASGGDLIAGSSTHVMTGSYEGVDIMFGGSNAFFKIVSKVGDTGLLAQGITGLQGVEGPAGSTGIQGQTGVA